jgi:ATP-dependent protease ClpP protease subunit
MIKDPKEFRKQAIALAETGVIPVFGEFNPDLEEIVLDCIEIARSKGLKQVRLLINSNGGRNGACAAIRAAMLLSGIKFVGIVLGYARSNGFQLLMACQWRCALPTSQLEFHWGNATLDNGSIAALIAGETWPIEHVKSNELEDAKVVSRRTGIAVEELIKMAASERDFNGPEALAAGLIDQVLEEPPADIKIPEVE